MFPTTKVFICFGNWIFEVRDRIALEFWWRKMNIKLTIPRKVSLNLESFQEIVKGIRKLSRVDGAKFRERGREKVGVDLREIVVNATKFPGYGGAVDPDYRDCYVVKDYAWIDSLRKRVGSKRFSRDEVRRMR